MHELSYCEGVLEAVERRAAGRPVVAVGVRVGAVHRIVDEAFQQSFSLVAAGGPAANAVTHLVVVPGDEVILEWLEYADTTADADPELVPEHTHAGGD